MSQYVIAFKPRDKVGMRMETKVPSHRDYRPYYGIMSVEYESTNTMSSKTFEQMGGWGSDIVIFATKTKVRSMRGAKLRNIAAANSAVPFLTS